MKNKRQYARYQIVFLLLAFVLFAALIMNINTGSVRISTAEIIRILGDSSSTQPEAVIIWIIRLPRLLSAALFGGALSVSGFLLQTYFRNPIAGPFVLGISSGARMFVGFVMIFLMSRAVYVSSYTIVAAAFIGSLFSMLIVLLLSQKVRNPSMLVVIGIMIGYVCSAVTDFFIAFAKDSHIANLTSWSMGSFSGAKWSDVQISAGIILTGLLAAVVMSKPINAFQLGESYAQSMGINIKVFRILLVLLSSLLSACATAFAGPISFVGIAVPHITKLLFNTAKPIVTIPGCFLCGAAFCMICDLIARTVFSPTELAIGTVTSFFGAPIVIWLMVNGRRSQYDE